MSISDLLQAAAYLESIEKINSPPDRSSSSPLVTARRQITIDNGGQGNFQFHAKPSLDFKSSSPYLSSSSSSSSSSASSSMELNRGESVGGESENDDDDDDDVEEDEEEMAEEEQNEFASSIAVHLNRRRADKKNESTKSDVAYDSPSSPTSNRASHNELEKNRRAHLRHCLDQVKLLVPTGTDTSRYTTLGLLTKTRIFIKNLEQQQKVLRFKKMQVRAQLNELLTRARAICFSTEAEDTSGSCQMAGGQVVQSGAGRRSQSLSSLSTVSAGEEEPIDFDDADNARHLGLDLRTAQTGGEKLVDKASLLSFLPYAAVASSYPLQTHYESNGSATFTERPCSKMVSDSLPPIDVLKPTTGLLPTLPFMSTCPYATYTDVLVGCNKQLIAKGDYSNAASRMHANFPWSMFIHAAGNSLTSTSATDDKEGRPT